MSYRDTQRTQARSVPVLTDWNGVIAELFDIERTYLQDSPSQDSSSGIASDDHNTASATSGSSPTYDFIEQNVTSTRSRSKHLARQLKNVSLGRSNSGYLPSREQHPGYIGSSKYSSYLESGQYSGYESDYVDLDEISRRDNLASRRRHAYRETDLDDPWSDCTLVSPEQTEYVPNHAGTAPNAYTGNSQCTALRPYTGNTDRTPRNFYTGRSPESGHVNNKHRVVSRNVMTSERARTKTDVGLVTSSHQPTGYVESMTSYCVGNPTVCYFDIVPDDVLLRIFRYLPSDQLCRNCRVCLRWYNVVWDPILWTSLRINDSTIDADLALHALTRRLSYETPTVCAIVEKINLSGCEKLTDRGLYTIAKLCPDLRHLELKGCLNVSNIALCEVVSNCVNLEHLNVAGCVYITCICLTPEAIVQSANYGKQIYLHHLDMTDCHQLDDPGLHIITSYCTKLTNLYLRRCHRVTDLGIQYLANYCANLRELSVSDCPNVTDFGLRELAKLGSNLRYLSVAKCGQVSDVGIRHLATYCTRLRYLNVRGCDAVSDDSVDVLARCCTRLRSLDIGKCDVTDDGLHSLAMYSRQLRKLSVKGCDAITDEGIVDLALHCPDLQQFNIQDCSVTIDAYRTVKRSCKHCVIEHTNPAFY